jgi:glucosamine--fructose-6-phosphate aminotransferase (isomerizing)
LALAEVALPLPPDLPEWLSPMAAVVPGQMWALGLCLARGMEPDAPRGLSKVTHTR